AAKGVAWHLRYRAGSTSAYKWEFVGGPDLFTEGGGSIKTAASEAAPVKLTGGPTLVFPLNGDYEICMGLFLALNVPGATNVVGYLVKNEEIANRIGWIIFVASSQFGGATMQGRAALGVEAGKNYHIYCGNSGSLECNFSSGRFFYRPIRVG